MLQHCFLIFWAGFDYQNHWFTVQWEQNGGKCGLCGDPHHLKEPRPHEAGGLFAKGIITRHYSVGQLIDVEVELTANHYGRFEMYLCPNNNYKQEATQECLNKYPLYVAGTKEVSYVIPEDGKKKAIFRYKVQLPPYVTCTQCVIQWTYFTGNQWGDCSNGTEAVGCGRSETFKNCADVAILSNTAGAIPPLFAGTDNFLDFYRSSFKMEPYKAVYPLLVKEQVCVPKTKYKLVPEMSEWCQMNCLRYPSNCPKNVCECPWVFMFVCQKIICIANNKIWRKST